MIFEWILLPILAFFTEYIDVVLGMGFGTIMTPLLIELGHSPLEVLPVMLLLQAIAGLIGGIFHYEYDNIDIFTKDNLRIISIFIIAGTIGAIVGSFIATHIRVDYLKLIIGVVVISAGVIIFLEKFLIKKGFSYPRLVLFGVGAAFTKSMTGVYGPIVTAGQIISGVESKQAVAITIMAEGVTSLVGFFAFYYFVGVNFTLFWPLLIGVLLAIPLSTYTVKFLPRLHLRRAISILTMILGVILIIKTIV